MGHKPSNNFQSDRPESGGADHHDERENSGLLDRGKKEFAEAEQKKHSGSVPDHPHKGDSHKQKAEPPYTTTGPLTAPKFGSAGSGGAELDPRPRPNPTKP
mgnify:CR=1 FL=1